MLHKQENENKISRNKISLRFFTLSFQHLYGTDLLTVMKGTTRNLKEQQIGKDFDDVTYMVF